MKKNVYFGIIGIGAVLAIIGFFPGGIGWIWGILIAAVTGVLYYINTQNEKRVQERLDDEKGMFQRDATPEEDDSSEPAAEAAPEEEKEGDEAGE